MKFTNDLLRLTTFNGWLRHHRPEHNNVWGEAAFRFAFPEFDPPEWTEETISEAMKDISPHVDNVVLQPSQHRRFGGYDLGRGRYYSVSIDQFGDDGGTLVAELSAYRDRKDQAVIVAVTDGEHLADQLFDAADVTAAKNSSIVISVFPASRLRMVVEEMGPSRLDRMSDPRAMGYLTDENLVHVIISPHVSRHTIENVVDLREPLTRKSFFNVFRTGRDRVAPDSDDEIFHRPFGNNIETFAQMLPELLDVNVGGSDHGQGGTTQAIGNYLQCNGMSGLIYPSARADAFVEFHEGEMSRFAGWNYVDYRESETIFGNNVIMSPWDQKAPPGFVVQSPSEGPYSGSLQTRGVRDFNEQLYENSYGYGRNQLLSKLNAGAPAVVFCGSMNLDLLAAKK